MTDAATPITILMAEDDPDDRELTRSALSESRLANELRMVADGEELLDYLYLRGAYAEPGSAPRPDIVLLDLNMPKLDGREALETIKRDPELRAIPIVILTTSRSEEDVYRSYDLGAASYISKPVTFEGLVEVMRGIGDYWVQIVQLPRR